MDKKLRAPLLALVIWVSGVLFWWGLAFYPTGEGAPPWLDTARQVCFGSINSGLPDATGWMVLILGPLSFLIFGVLIWLDEFKKLFTTYFQTIVGRVFLLGLLVPFSIEGSWVLKKVSSGISAERFSLQGDQQEDLPEAYPRAGKDIYDFSLIDQNNKQVRLSDFSSEIILLTFAFSHCETVCPMIVQQALDVQKQIPNLRLLVITLDPWRDTPKSLPYLAKKWGFKENAHVLSERPEIVEDVLKRLQVPYQRNDETGDVVHPALTYIIDKNTRVAFQFNNVPTKWFIQAVERVKKDGSIAAATR